MVGKSSRKSIGGQEIFVKRVVTVDDRGEFSRKQHTRPDIGRSNAAEVGTRRQRPKDAPNAGVAEYDEGCSVECTSTQP